MLIALSHLLFDNDLVVTLQPVLSLSASSLSIRLPAFAARNLVQSECTLSQW